jgi:hypothetical protein
MAKKTRLRSIKQALEWTRDMWAWLAKNPGQAIKKLGWPGWKTRQQCMHNCACCEIVGKDCSRCPLKNHWGAQVGGQLPCADNLDSPYRLWILSGHENVSAAQQISNAAAAELKKRYAPRTR